MNPDEKQMARTRKNKSFGSIIQEYRQRYGWTQEELGWRAGISREHVGRIERDKCVPSVLTIEEEAHIFADQQKHVKSLSSYETFKAHIEADDPKQKMIEAIVRSYGLSVTSTKARNGISAVSTLERIYDKYGQAVLDRTLRLAAATWEGEDNSFSGSILMGIARIVVAYGDSIRDDVFKDHVGRVSVKAIIRAAKERRPGALGYAEAMILEYNKKSKYRLSLRTLYGGKPVNSEDDFVEE